MSQETVDFSILLRVLETNKRKVVQQTAKSILKKTELSDNKPKHKFSFKSVNDARDVYELAAYLFMFEDYDLCYEVCCIYDSFGFNKDYTWWSYIRNLRCMKCSIERMRGNEVNAQAIIDELLPYQHPELYDNQWNQTYSRAFELEKEYKEEISSNSTSKYTRISIMGIAMTCNTFLQLHIFPDKEDMIKDWINRISKFMQTEEK